MTAPPSNELRMPLLEWMVKMAEADVPYQARALALYATLSKIGANDELAKLTGMDSKGAPDKTYNKWKKYLSDHGWVIVRQVTVGRSHTVEIAPAYRETPVTFTDIKAKDHRKYYGSVSVTFTPDAPIAVTFTEPSLDNKAEGGEPVKVTTEPASLPVEITDEQRPTVIITDTSSTPVKITDVKIPPYPPIINNYPKELQLPPEYDAARGDSGGCSADLDHLDCLNGTAVDLISFIRKHAHMPEANARRALENNIRTFSAQAMMEAYAVTTAEMATGMVGNPYKYLINVAKNVRSQGGGRATGGRSPAAAAAGETRAQRMQRIAQEEEDRINAERAKRGSKLQ